MRRRLAVLLFTCYFLPFCLFFFTTSWFANVEVFATSLATVALCTLLLFLSLKKWQLSAINQPPAPAPSPFLKVTSPDLHHLVLAQAGKTLRTAPTHKLLHTDRLLELQLQVDRLSHEMANAGSFFDKQRSLLKTQLHEMAREKELSDQVSAQKIQELSTLVKQQEEEIANLKFELRILFRLDEKILSSQIQEESNSQSDSQV